MFKKQKYDERKTVEGCVRNERKAQELLYRTHFDTMMRMCMRYTNDKDKAMEIVNIGFLTVFQKPIAVQQCYTYTAALMRDFYLKILI